MKNFLKTQGTQIVTREGAPVFLRGVNLGGWLMMEGYILHAPNVAEHFFKEQFSQALGEETLKEFEEAFRKNFISETDFKIIKDFGFNCIRVPFNYRLIEKRNGAFDEAGLAYLDSVIDWAGKNKIWIILDLHAAHGSQNYDWHSDSSGKAELWLEKDFQQKTLGLWKFLANRYKDHEWVAGYDLLNESVIDNAKSLNGFYQKMIDEIRSVDPQHIVFVEGNRWATDLECLMDFKDDNVALSVHFYEPIEFTFNFVPGLSYPLKTDKGGWDKATMKKRLESYFYLAKKRNLPILVGEFGVNSRDGFYAETDWLKDVVGIFNQFGFHWTYWTYKAVKNSIFPDGIFSYDQNPPWVNRQGPKTGWETFSALWPKNKKDMMQSWKTGSFKENSKIAEILKNAAK